jgi:hypothetical protein
MTGGGMNGGGGSHGQTSLPGFPSYLGKIQG